MVQNYMLVVISQLFQQSQNLEEQVIHYLVLRLMGMTLVQMVEFMILLFIIMFYMQRVLSQLLVVQQEII